MSQGPLEPLSWSTSSAVYDPPADRIAEQRDLLRCIAIDYQAVVRNSRQSLISVHTPPADFSALEGGIESYAALERARYSPPEQVLARIKGVTGALSGQLSPSVAELLQAVVMHAFLVGYYGPFADAPSTGALSAYGRTR